MHVIALEYDLLKFLGICQDQLTAANQRGGIIKMKAIDLAH